MDKSTEGMNEIWRRKREKIWGKERKNNGRKIIKERSEIKETVKKKNWKNERKKLIEMKKNKRANRWKIEIIKEREWKKESYRMWKTSWKKKKERIKNKE